VTSRDILTSVWQSDEAISLLKNVGNEEKDHFASLAMTAGSSLRITLPGDIKGYSHIGLAK